MIWNSRKEAEEYYLEAMANTEGSESARYATIYTQLKSGYTVCTDDE